MGRSNRKPDFATVATSGSYNDLTNKPTIPSAQVNSDWNASSGAAQILNKPTIPTNTNQLTNGAGFITGITSGNVTSALGYTPYDATNPAGYTSNTGTVTSVTAGNGMKQTGTSTVNPTINVVSHAGTAGSIGTIDVSADAIGVNLGTTSTTAFRGDYGNTAYTDRMKWDGGSSGLNASNGRSSLGATTVGSNLFTSTNPSAVRFLRTNADNSVSWLDAASFRSAIGAGTSSTNGTVTSVNISVPTGLAVSGGPVTSAGTLAVSLASGYSIPTTSNQTKWNTAYSWGDHAGLYLPVDYIPAWGEVTGKPDFSAVATSGSYNDLTNKPTIPSAQVNSDWNASSGAAQILNKPTIPTNTNQLTNGAGFITGITSGNVTSALGYTPYDATNPAGYTSNNGTVTSVTAGNGMTQTGTSTVNPTINVVSHAGTAGSIGTINVSADAIGVNLGTTSTTAFRGDYGNTAYTDRMKWDGGSSGLNASNGRSSLGATTVGSNLFTSTNPSAVRFLRTNADNSVSWLDAASFRSAIGAGTSSTNGTVSSVSIVTASGVSGTVVNATTTPSIKLSLGDISPNSVAATGIITGSNLSGTNTGDVTIGISHGLSLSGQAISLGLASTSSTGALSSADWNTFNNKGDMLLSATQTVTGLKTFDKKIAIKGTSTGVTQISSDNTSASNYVIHLPAATGTVALTSDITNGTVTSVGMTTPTGLTVSGGPITSSGTLALSLASGYSIPTTASQSNWNTAYSDRMKWDGGSSGLNASTARSSLGATTLGENIFTSLNPSKVRFLRTNADNSISWLDATAFRNAIGAGDVGGSGTTNYIPKFTASGTIGNSGLQENGAHLYYNGSDGMVVTGEFQSQNHMPQEANGAGVRMAWLPMYAAFRAGGVSGTQWDDGSGAIGEYSTAFGYNTTASGSYSTAMGYQTIASSFASLAAGAGSEASGSMCAYALGFEATASGNNSFATGYRAKASSDYAFAAGYYATASGQASVAMGQYATASGESSVAFGKYATASGNNSVAIGKNVSTNSYSGSIFMGDASSNTTAKNDRTNQMKMRFTGGYKLFTDDEGADAAKAVVVAPTSGNLGVGTDAPTSKLDVNGSVSHAITILTGYYSSIDANMHTVILQGSVSNVIIPDAYTAEGRVYIIVNQTSRSVNCTNDMFNTGYRNLYNTNTTTIPKNTSITIQSDGTYWYLIQ